MGAVAQYKKIITVKVTDMNLQGANICIEYYNTYCSLAFFGIRTYLFATS